MGPFSAGRLCPVLHAHSSTTHPYLLYLMGVSALSQTDNFFPFHLTPTCTQTSLQLSSYAARFLA